MTPASVKQNLEILTTVYMIDEHPVFQLGLQRLLRRSNEFTVIGFGTSLRELELSRKTPDIIIIDFVVDRSRGIGIIRDLKRCCPTAYVLVLTTQDESLFAERCLRAGAQGYVMKSSPNSDCRIRASFCSKCKVRPTEVSSSGCKYNVMVSRRRSRPSV